MADHWLACRFPEKPADAAMAWHCFACAACRMKVEVVLRCQPDFPHADEVAAMMDAGPL